MLCREARNADSLYGLFAEGWAMQALALPARSPRHFMRAFRESAGQTPLRFVYSLRLERAKEFLSSCSAWLRLCHGHGCT